MSDTATEGVPRTFAVGDRVRYHGVGSTMTREFEGLTGTVSAVEPRDNITVTWDHPPGIDNHAVLSANLEPYVAQSVAQRIVEDLLGRANIGGGLQPNHWIPEYRETLEAQMPRVVESYRTSRVPSGVDLTVGTWLCQRWGTIPHTGTFEDFSAPQRAALGQWWNENVERFMSWTEPEESIEASDSEPRRPVVGDRLRITEENTHSTGYSIGQIVEVTSVRLRVNGDVSTMRVQPVRVDDTLDSAREMYVNESGRGWEFLAPVEDVRTPRCGICGVSDEESAEWCGECGNCTAHHGPGCDVFGQTEPIPVGTRCRLLPRSTTASGGGVYFAPNVTEVEVTDRGAYDPTGPDVRVRRLNGNDDIADQTVGRQFLRKMVQPSESEGMVPDEPTLPGMDAVEVERLRRELAEATAKIAGMEQDAAIIGEMFGRAAVKENLCGVYERTVERVNERLSFLTLDADRPSPATVTATRVRKMEVWVEETGTLECSDHDDDCEHDEGDFAWEDRGYTEHVVAAARENFDETSETDDFTITS